MQRMESIEGGAEHGQGRASYPSPEDALAPVKGLVFGLFLSFWIWWVIWLIWRAL
jgi:hypothetical protein